MSRASIQAAHRTLGIPPFGRPGLGGLLPALLLAFSCGETYRTVEDTSLEKTATVKLGSFERTAVDASGRTLWRLKGREAYIFEKKRRNNRIVAYAFDFEQYDERGKSIAAVQALRGEVDYDGKQLFLTGNVTFRGQAREIRSQKMRYDWEQKIVSSDAPVVIVEQNLYTRCSRGVVVFRQNERQICKGPAGSHRRAAGKSGSGVDDIFQ